MALRQAQGNFIAEAPVVTKTGAAAKANTPPPKAFTDRTFDVFSKGSVLFGILTLVASKTAPDTLFLSRVRTLFFGCATVCAYVWGARLPASFTNVVHPLVTCCVIVLVIVQALGLATGSSFLDTLRTYKVGSLAPLKTGAGDVLLYLLGPSVVSFAIAMFSRRALLRQNLLVVVLATFVSSVGGLFGTAAFVRAISLGGADGRLVRLSVLSRNVTTALAMALTTMIGGDISIAASVVVLTGILGATYARTFLTAMGVVDPVCRGLGVGASSQGLGVASMSGEPDAFPFAAVAMVLTAMTSTTLVAIPAVRESLVSLATGAVTAAAAAAAEV